MTGADIVLEALEREGVELIFGYPGGANLPIYQQLPRHPKLRHVLVRHEQGAAHMADGYARASGRPGVLFATSGPGALNTITGLATAFMDSVPLVAITGQVNTTVVGRDAFQESDVVGCSMPVTKHNYLITDIHQIPGAVKEAFHIASTGRPGPVLIDICKDVQQADWPAPVWADLLMCVGTRVDDRVTAKLADWAPRAETFIHVDIDRSEMGKNRKPHMEVVADAKTALREMLPHVQTPEPERRRPWLTQIDRWREEHPLRYTRSNGHLQPQDVMIEMYRRCADDAIVVADVGQNQIWAALWWNYTRPGLFINSGGAGTMGFAFPAAVGAKFARPEKAVWCVAGEGGFG